MPGSVLITGVPIGRNAGEFVLEREDPSLLTFGRLAGYPPAIDGVPAGRYHITFWGGSDIPAGGFDLEVRDGEATTLRFEDIVPFAPTLGSGVPVSEVRIRGARPGTYTACRLGGTRPCTRLGFSSDTDPPSQYLGRGRYRIEWVPARSECDSALGRANITLCKVIEVVPPSVIDLAHESLRQVCQAPGEIPETPASMRAEAGFCGGVFTPEAIARLGMPAGTRAGARPGDHLVGPEGEYAVVQLEDGRLDALRAPVDRYGEGEPMGQLDPVSGGRVGAGFFPPPHVHEFVSRQSYEGERVLGANGRVYTARWKRVPHDPASEYPEPRGGHGDFEVDPTPLPPGTAPDFSSSQYRRSPEDWTPAAIRAYDATHRCALRQEPYGLTTAPPSKSVCVAGAVRNALGSVPRWAFYAGGAVLGVGVAAGAVYLYRNRKKPGKSR
jgi:hypothetical protein